MSQESTYITVFALFRDSEKHLRRSLTQFAALEKLPGVDLDFCFYSNDNKDGTSQMLNNWCNVEGRKARHFTETLNAPRFGSVANNVRTAMLAYYRNQNARMADGKSYEYALVVDSDLIWTTEDFYHLWQFMESKHGEKGDSEDAIMVGSNSRQNIKDLVFGLSEDSFYDVYPLFDSWGNQGMYFTDSPFYDEKDHDDFLNGNPVQVNSGFGGMALIRGEAFRRVKWSSDFTSEHIHFCNKLRNYGKIYLHPKSKPLAEIDLATINMENCKKIAAQQFSNFRIGTQMKRMSLADTFQFK